jgi:hypothetical protein
MREQGQSQLCLYCNREVADTIDHIPSKLLLAKPFPDNLLTVPSCLRCNSSFQKDDEYTRVITAIDIRNANHQAVQANMPAILRSLQRPEARKFSEYLAKQTVPSTVLGADGKPMGQIIEVDRNRLNATGERIVRGLYFAETKLVVPSSARVRVASISGVTASEPQPMIQQLALLYSKCTEHRAKVVGNVFNYAAAFHPDFSVWLMVLYDDFAWMVSITNSGK